MGDFVEKFVEQLHNTASAWQIKVMVGGIVSLLVDYHQSHYVIVAQSFFWLVILDMITKFFAISYQYLLDHGVPKENITLWDSFKAWGLAFNDKKITSAAMTRGFISKMIQFALILTASVYIDNSLGKMNIALPISALTFCIGYICYSEFLSITENLRDSGVAHMDKLVELLNSNVFSKLRK